MKTKSLLMALMALMMCSLTASAEEAEINGLWYEVVTRAKEAKVIRYKSTYYSGDVVIPETVDYNGVTCSVTSIGENAFYYCIGLTSVTIPNSVTSIGNGAFYYCIGLTSVTIPGSVTSIGEIAFYGCSGLTSVHITDLASWCKITYSDVFSNPLYYAHHLFLNGEEIKDLVIPNSVTSIGRHAFEGCSGLTSVTIGDGVTSIGGWAFSDCSGLTSVTIPNSVTSIGGYAFSGCRGLTSVTIPNSVTSIREWAFYECSGLTSVTIGSGIQKIGSRAFAKCPELADVYCYAENVPTTQSNAFEDSYSHLSTLHVPASAINIYQTTEPWNGFGTIVTLDGDEPVVEQCAKPTIHYQNGKLSFKCATEGVEFVSEITDADIKKNYTAEVDLSVTYHISVYAIKTGFDNSETVTATLCWIDVEPQKEGITEGDEDAVTEVKAMPVLIQSEGNGLMVSGAQAGTPISVYDLSGRLIGNTTAVEGTTKVQTATSEKVVIVKVGERSVRVMK